MTPEVTLITTVTKLWTFSGSKDKARSSDLKVPNVVPAGIPDFFGMVLEPPTLEVFSARVFELLHLKPPCKFLARKPPRVNVRKVLMIYPTGMVTCE